MTRTTRTLRRVLLVLAVGLVATTCASVRSTPEMRYYVLALASNDALTLPAPVRVEELSIDDPYATRQLAYRTSRYRINYYNYHRWAGSPAVVVAAATREYLERASRNATGAPFEIAGRIRRLEEVDTDDHWGGALTIEFTVHREGVLVLEQSYSETEPATERNPEAVVAALSRALQRILDALSARLAASGTAGL